VTKIADIPNAGNLAGWVEHLLETLGLDEKATYLSEWSDHRQRLLVACDRGLLDLIRSSGVTTSFDGTLSPWAGVEPAVSVSSRPEAFDGKPVSEVRLTLTAPALEAQGKTDEDADGLLDFVRACIKASSK
jgi:hypothetical protein